MSSSNADLAIQAEGLSKAYSLGEQRSLLGGKRGTSPAVHWALDDVSFDIKRGEAVGIIGHNGAGKSTLLKILSRITEPTKGRATIYGRVASLLEVGTGFHPELTGRENIFMNGSILGMRRAEITLRLDDIIEFAGVHNFVDTPVKRYSSGMQLRLAFSVAAHLQPEILVIDEVLAVGDVQFQKKCMGMMGEVSRSGRTVLFVSHNMAAVRQLTTRCILMSQGRLAFDGEPGKAVEAYSDAMSTAFGQGADLARWPRKLYTSIDRMIEFRSLSFIDSKRIFGSGESIRFKAVLRAREAIEGIRISGTIMHSEGYSVGTFWSENNGSLATNEEGSFVIDLGDIRLAPGSYSLQLATGIGNEIEGYRDFDLIAEVLPFEVGAFAGDGGVMGAWHSTWGAVRFPSAKMICV